MSDYGDDYSDYGEDWFYVEEEYMAADDLAEHAVASPPPTTYGDEDGQPEWDRFDYFNDLEYASDGYDDATFAAHPVTGAQAGQKRKRVHKAGGARKRRTVGINGTSEATRLQCSPVVWRSHEDRNLKPKYLEHSAAPYALLKDWRKTLAETPRWAHASPNAESPTLRPAKLGKAKAAHVSAPVSPPLDIANQDEDVDDEDEDMGISQDALMAALQRQLAAAGGPLGGMDPQQLLEFAMRMATDKDAGDDIAGEMADAMLEGDDEEDDTGAEDNLLSWVAQQRNANKDVAEDTPKSPIVASDTKRPPTPPSSEANRSVRASVTTTKTVESTTKPSGSKRKADEDVDGEGSTKVVKKRVTRSFDAPTTASQAKAAPAKATRSTRAKRS